jgi:hypothetical protein
MTRTDRNLHWASVAANASGIVTCLLALSLHPEWARSLCLLIGWMVLNGAVSTRALRGKG